MLSILIFIIEVKNFHLTLKMLGLLNLINQLILVLVCFHREFQPDSILLCQQYISLFQFIYAGWKMA
ncbi:hypothetical protein DC094_08275 [Pelagibaculum spongiae]|uniref:Uncharacterized protein n=1 Tax=Pelagibaculum spongiae TaxID=2080658 RepID=A0A2V1GYX1_9GAMM|nr:hypothetical protein DC094_08275 [Pelagibaculum spongiae]